MTDQLTIAQLDRIAADGERRADEAAAKAEVFGQLTPEHPEAAFWQREAARLEDLARRERQRHADAVAAHESAQAHPEPF